MDPPSNFQKWEALARARPELAGRGSAMLVRHGLAYLATASSVGRPRVTPVSVVFDDGSLYVSLIRSTAKCRELWANPFFHLHALPGVRWEEFSVRGRARVIADDREIARLRQAHEASAVVCGEDDAFFELLLDRVDLASFATESTGTVTARRDGWTPTDEAPKRGCVPATTEGGE